MGQYASLIKTILTIAVVLTIVFGARWVFNTWEENKRLRGQMEQEGRTNQATDTIATAVTEATNGRQVVEVKVSQERGNYMRQYEDLARSNPTVAAYADTPVPDELRELARQRRLARDRLGSAAPGSPSADPAAPAQR